MPGKARNAYMSRKLAAAAVAGAGMMLGGPAAAFDLSIYGVGHLSVDRIDTGPASSGYLHSNSSRLGFKGNHDLARGLALLFQYESGVDLTGRGTGDGNGGAISNGQIFTRARDSFIGVGGGWGTARVGRLGALNQWLYDYNLFGDQVGDLGNIWGGDGLPGRLDSVAQYRTPDFGGFSLALSYAPEQGVDKGDSTVAKADFGRGGLKVGAALARFGVGIGQPRVGASALTASYDFGAFNVGGGVQREKDIAGVSGADRNKATLGAAMKVGAGAVKAQFARAGDLRGNSDTGARQFAVGYDHAWDKSTTLYVAYARTTNDGAASYTSYDYGHGDQGVPALIAGNKPSALSIGLVYKFDETLLRR